MNKKVNGDKKTGTEYTERSCNQVKVLVLLTWIIVGVQICYNFPVLQM
jgi:hypothetical protein